ncbi:MAG: polysaccharide biosynthesis/export family protein [Bacteroidales bacterium]|nr:polysaccharide biosynthesis/export family protein [Bacteroidales bacterium]
MKKYLTLAAIVAAAFSLFSCKSSTYKKINYLQDVSGDTTMTMAATKGIVIQPKDQLSIVVSSRTPALAAEFNLPVASYQAGTELYMEGSSMQRLLGYVVDNDGRINFPVLGMIEAAGKTRWELQNFIRDEIIAGGYIKDPIVTVEFLNFKISVLGEVNSPGTFTIAGDKITIFGALALARDLTIYGRRDRIQIIRENGDARNIYMVDLRDSDIFNSPAYYLQQNDMIYVEPNSVRAGQSTINENYFKSGAFWISLASISFTAASLAISVYSVSSRNNGNRQ